MATLIKRTGFGQVEPNHLSAQRTAQIYAQLPAADGIDILENGQYVKYDYAATVGGSSIGGTVDFTGAGEWMMVFNEVKLYDDGWRESYKDYAMKRVDFTDKQVVPRVIKTNVGDIYTTNAIGAGNTGGKIEFDTAEGAETLAVGDQLKVNTTNGFLSKTGDDTSGMVWQVVAETTTPDGQPAVKVMRIK